jgi:hypothetical protein
MPLVSIAVESGLCLLLESAAQRLGPTTVWADPPKSPRLPLLSAKEAALARVSWDRSIAPQGIPPLTK